MISFYGVISSLNKIVLSLLPLQSRSQVLKILFPSFIRQHNYREVESPKVTLRTSLLKCVSDTMASRKWFRNHSPFLLSGYTHCIFLLFFMFSVIKLCPCPKPTTWKLDHIMFFFFWWGLGLELLTRGMSTSYIQKPEFLGVYKRDITHIHTNP